MIIAICIYNLDRSYTRIQFAQQKGVELFPVNKLENLEKFSLPEFSQNINETSGYYFYENEHHYLYKPNKTEKIVLTIVSKTPLDRSELYYLFANINHVWIRPQAVNTTLDDIVRNPLGYTGKNLLMQAIQRELDQTMVELNKALDNIMERGEALKELETTTFQLGYTSAKFKRESSKLNSCCWR